MLSKNGIRDTVGDDEGEGTTEQKGNDTELFIFVHVLLSTKKVDIHPSSIHPTENECRTGPCERQNLVILHTKTHN